MRAWLGDTQIEGLDLLDVDEHGQIVDFTVMIRPINGLLDVAADVIRPVAPGRDAPVSDTLRDTQPSLAKD